MGDELLLFQAILGISTLQARLQTPTPLILRSNYPGLNQIYQRLLLQERVTSVKITYEDLQGETITAPYTILSENPIRTFFKWICTNLGYNTSLEVYADMYANFIPLRFPKIDRPGGAPIVITYQTDWRMRTAVNTEEALRRLKEELTRKIINPIIILPDVGPSPIGTIGRQSTDVQIENTWKAVNLLSSSDLHLGMVGGSTVLATVCGVNTVTTLEHHYTYQNPKNIQNLETYKDWLAIRPEVWTSQTRFKSFKTSEVFCTSSLDTDSLIKASLEILISSPGIIKL